VSAPQTVKQLIRTSGKVILAGEHGVVRGGEALVFPLRSRSFELTWEPADTAGFHFQSTDSPFREPFLFSLDRALAISGFKLPHSGYGVNLRSDIPIQAGLGSSAALSVAVVRFLEKEGARFESPFALALEIENIFHGKSSGIDVAAVLSDSPILYSRTKSPSRIPLAWSPLLYLKDTGKRSQTKECVAKVEAAKRPDLDQRMANSVQVAKTALASTSANRLSDLADAIELAAGCFEEWGLGTEPQLVQELKSQGALAVKPTGSGGGGFLLSLWAAPPPEGYGLIPIWEDFSEPL
jgi:mevalonate kinase